MKRKLINKMVDRFLQWQLPADFTPDGGISFDGKSHPVGTNLLTAVQAKVMLEHVLGAALPAPDRFSTEEEGDAFTHGYFEGHDDSPAV